MTLATTTARSPRFPRVLLALAGLALAPAALAADKVDLTPRYKEGQKVTFVQRTKRSDTMTVNASSLGGQETTGEKPGADDEKKKALEQMAKGQTTTLDQTATYELRCTGATPESVNLELELKGVKAEMKTPRGEFAWDSSAPADDKDESNPAYQALKPALTAVLKITIGPDGNISKIEGDPRVNATPQGPMAASVQMLVNPDQVAARWGPILWVKDGREPAAVGGTWKDSSETTSRQMGAKFKYDSTMTLESVKGDEATVKVATDLKLEPLDGKSAPQAEVKDPKIGGTIVWDLKAGMAKSAVQTARTTLSVNAMNLPVARTSDVTVETVRKD